MKIRNAAIAAGLLVAARHASAAQQQTAAERDPVRHLADLVAQCPPDPRLSAEAEKQVPIDVTNAGASGEPILIIHGGEKAVSAIGGGPQNFDRQLALGHQGSRVVLPSRPGFGKSPARGQGDQITDQRWIAPMLRANVSSHVWGHSFGGAEALLAAAAAPTTVRSLVLVEPDLWPLAEALPKAEQPSAVDQERADRPHSLLSSDSPAAYASAFISSFQPKTSGAKVWLTRKASAAAPGLSDKVGCGALLAHEATGDDFLKAARIVRDAHIPVLVVTGGWGKPRDALGEVVARTLGGQHVIVPSKDHIVMHDDPTVFDRTVVELMRTARPRAGS